MKLRPSLPSLSFTKGTLSALTILKFCAMKIFLTSISKFFSSMYLSSGNQLNVGCFKYGPTALGPVLPATFLKALPFASHFTSVITLTTDLGAWMAA